MVKYPQMSPPVGMDVFQVSGVTDVPTYTIFRGVAPFVVATLLCVAILYVFLQIATFLPGTMAKRGRRR